MDAGSLAHTPPLEEEPDEPNDAVIDVLAEAERSSMRQRPQRSPTSNER
jgi:hypothetical protein